MPSFYPLCIDLSGRSVVMIGAGAVATSRLPELLRAGAVVRVISPEAAAPFHAAFEEGRIELLLRNWLPGDEAGAFLVLAATNDSTVNREIYRRVAERDGLINVCDDPAHCNVAFASRIERGPMILSIFSNGVSPALSRRIRRDLENAIGPEYGLLGTLMGELRVAARGIAGLAPKQRQALMEAVVYSEALPLFRENRVEDARAHAWARFHQTLETMTPAGRSRRRRLKSEVQTA